MERVDPCSTYIVLLLEGIGGVYSSGHLTTITAVEKDLVLVLLASQVIAVIPSSPALRLQANA